MNKIKIYYNNYNFNNLCTNTWATKYYKECFDLECLNFSGKFYKNKHIFFIPDHWEKDRHSKGLYAYEDFLTEVNINVKSEKALIRYLRHSYIPNCIFRASDNYYDKTYQSFTYVKICNNHNKNYYDYAYKLLNKFIKTHQPIPKYTWEDNLISNNIKNKLEQNGFIVIGNIFYGQNCKGCFYTYNNSICWCLDHIEMFNKISCCPYKHCVHFDIDYFLKICQNLNFEYYYVL